LCHLFPLYQRIETSQGCIDAEHGVEKVLKRRKLHSVKVIGG
jgi:hypothetical protein